MERDLTIGALWEAIKGRDPDSLVFVEVDGTMVQAVGTHVSEGEVTVVASTKQWHAVGGEIG